MRSGFVGIAGVSPALLVAVGLSRSARAGNKLAPTDDPSVDLEFPGGTVRWFLIGQNVDDDFVAATDELADPGKRHAAVGREESEVSHLHEPVRQGVLEAMSNAK